MHLIPPKEEPGGTDMGQVSKGTCVCVRLVRK